MASKKKQEDENLRVLREMVTLAHNKHCFDCNQRGPTYVNMTIGSFICTSCSGLLRGLNPPHRVKSISMASFTSEEMEFIKSRGNDFCRKVWLGIHDGRSLADSDLRDENKMRDLMSQKYEKKRWYVHPTDEFYEEARKQNTCSTHKQTGVKPISTLVGHNLPTLNVNANQPPRLGAAPASVATQSIQRPSHGSVYPSAGALQSAAVPSAPQSPTAKTNSHPPQKSASLDILADIGADPFAGTSMADQQSNAGGFADFSAFSSHPAAAQRSPGYLQPHPGQSSQPAWPNPTGPGAVPLQPVHSGNKAAVSLASSTTTAAAAASATADKYSALAELESVFSAMSGPSSVNWDGSSIAGMRGVGGYGAAPQAQQQGMSSGYAFSGPSHTNIAPPPSYASLGGGGTTSVANPFGMSGSQPTQTVASAAVVNPFMSNSSGVGASYNQPVASGFGQYHMAPTNIPVSTSSVGAMPGGFAQFSYMAPSGGVQNGGLSGGTVWGVMPPPQRSQVPQQTPGWGQPAQANPFGGMAPPRPSNVTNPFL